MNQKKLTTKSAVETEQIAQEIGKSLRGGEVIELSSDLGGGKTTFVRGLARGVGSPDHVSSPTFTISNHYIVPSKNAEVNIRHFDFYRLAEAGLIEHEIEDYIGDTSTVIVVEWSNVVQHVLPENRLIITIAVTGDESREISIQYPSTLSYLVESI